MTSETCQKTLWTVGHSNHALEVFLAMLRGEGIELVVDVRRFAGSRKHPQFGQAALATSLEDEAIGYEHLPALGGRRSQRLPNSPNNAWRVEAFNAYADHMQSDEFLGGVEQLMLWAAARRTVIMCAEVLPWQCHRRLIADYLVAHGWVVKNILRAGDVRLHTLNDMARVADGKVIYPAPLLF